MSLFEGPITLNRTYTVASVNGSDFALSDYRHLRGIFSGDIVSVNTSLPLAKQIQLVESRIRYTTIVGVLQLYSKYKFPRTKRNIERFKFAPLSSKFPHFLVSTTVKRKYATNVVAIIRYQDWPVNSTYPHGELVNVLGPVTETPSLYEGLLHKYDLVRRGLRLTKPERQRIQTAMLDDSVWIRDVPTTYVDLRSMPTTCSVDPPSTLDIDDAFSYHVCDSGNWTLYVHIADVVGTLRLHKLENVLHTMQRTTSVYAPHKTVHMFPPELSENVLSLLPNRPRLSLTMKVECTPDHTVRTVEFYKATILNKQRYSYEDFQRLSHSKYAQVFQGVQGLSAEDFHYSHSGTFDAHHFIEKCMILYNFQMGKYLRSRQLQTVYRCQNPPQHSPPLVHHHPSRWTHATLLFYVTALYPAPFTHKPPVFTTVYTYHGTPTAPPPFADL